MRSFTQNRTLRMLALSASLIAVPFAGAYAANRTAHNAFQGDGVNTDPEPVFDGSRIESIRNQLVGAEQGIRDAQLEKKITPAEAHTLMMRANTINRAVERTAARNGGRLPSGQYEQLMRRFDGLEQALVVGTGAAWDTGDSATSDYPNG